jgi:glucose/arabinose dehydrogenase
MQPPKRYTAAFLAMALILAACVGVSDPVPTLTPVPEQPTVTLQPSPAETATSLPSAAMATETAAPDSAPTEPPAETTPDEDGSPLETPTVTPLPTATAEPAPTATPPAFDPAAVDLSLVSIAAGLDRPVFATHAGDGSGRLFVVEKAGTIVVLEEEGPQPEPFLDIRDRVGSGGNEQGLLGLAFHPQFSSNGWFFVYYTDRNGSTVISRFEANQERTLADPNGERVLLTESQPAGNHNGGMLAFGPDGKLYAGLGDGGAANDRFGNGQNLGSILGTIIRLDVDGGDPYAIPADNPFVDQADALPEIWAFGLRNPWRFSFDRATGDLYIADVGQNQWEEVNFQAAGTPGGGNYGWPIMEASRCFQTSSCDQSGLLLPVTEYDHGQGCSVTGGYVYRGQAQPDIFGAYFYGDYCTGTIWALGRDQAGQWQSSALLESNLQISSFGETESGEILVVDLNGYVYQLQTR